MSNIKCPCKECISLAICRHKEYTQLFRQCSIINEHIPDSQCVPIRDEDRIRLLQCTLNPTAWEFVLDRKYDTKYSFVYTPEGKSPLLRIENNYDNTDYDDSIPPVLPNLYITKKDRGYE